MTGPDGGRLRREIEHDRRIAGKAEGFWGWAGPAGRARAARRAKMILAFLEGAPGPWLEIGCGKGVFSGFLGERARPRTYAAIDLSMEFLACAAAGARAAAFVCGDIHRLPFADRRFGAVLGVSVLHHLRCRAALEEIRRILAPGGRLALSEPNMANPLVFAQKLLPPVKALAGDVSHETAFLRGWLARDLAVAGFASVSVRPFDFLHPMVPDRCVAGIDAAGRAAERVPALREIAGSLWITAENPGSPGGKG